MILTTDWHLTGNPDDEYRWGIFPYLSDMMLELNDRDIVVLGDFVDRKDRHPAIFVDRLVRELVLLNAHIRILRGNHDTPLSGPGFWSFLNYVPRIAYIEAPTADTCPAGEFVMAPYLEDPSAMNDPSMVDDTPALLIHQTIGSPIGENGHVLETAQRLPAWAQTAGCPVYSGDVHVPQNSGGVCYVGAPHPIKYGDTYQGRVLHIKRDWRAPDSYDVPGPRKLTVTINRPRDLYRTTVRKGDMVKVIWSVRPDDEINWAAHTELLGTWAAETGVRLGPVETVLAPANPSPLPRHEESASTPSEILDEFCAQEQLSDDHREFARQILQENGGA